MRVFEILANDGGVRDGAAVIEHQHRDLGALARLAQVRLAIERVASLDAIGDSIPLYSSTIRALRAYGLVAKVKRFSYM